MAEGIPAWSRECLSGSRQATLGRNPGRPTGTQGWAADVGDRFFEGVLAAHRGTADAAGTDWQSAVCRKIQEEVKADRGLSIERIVELGRRRRSEDPVGTDAVLHLKRWRNLRGSGP